MTNRPNRFLKESSRQTPAMVQSGHHFRVAQEGFAPLIEGLASGFWNMSRQEARAALERMLQEDTTGDLGNSQKFRTIYNLFHNEKDAAGQRALMEHLYDPASGRYGINPDRAYDNLGKNIRPDAHGVGAWIGSLGKPRFVDLPNEDHVLLSGPNCGVVERATGDPVRQISYQKLKADQQKPVVEQVYSILNEDEVNKSIGESLATQWGDAYGAKSGAYWGSKNMRRGLVGLGLGAGLGAGAYYLQSTRGSLDQKGSATDNPPTSDPNDPNAMTGTQSASGGVAPAVGTGAYSNGVAPPISTAVPAGGPPPLPPSGVSGSGSGYAPSTDDPYYIPMPSARRWASSRFKRVAEVSPSVGSGTTPGAVQPSAGAAPDTASLTLQGGSQHLLTLQDAFSTLPKPPNFYVVYNDVCFILGLNEHQQPDAARMLQAVQYLQHMQPQVEQFEQSYDDLEAQSNASARQAQIETLRAVFAGREVAAQDLGQIGQAVGQASQYVGNDQDGNNRMDANLNLLDQMDTSQQKGQEQFAVVGIDQPTYEATMRQLMGAGFADQTQVGEFLQGVAGAASVGNMSVQDLLPVATAIFIRNRFKLDITTRQIGAIAHYQGQYASLPIIKVALEAAKGQPFVNDLNTIRLAIMADTMGGNTPESLNATQGLAEAIVGIVVPNLSTGIDVNKLAMSQQRMMQSQLAAALKFGEVRMQWQEDRNEYLQKDFDALAKAIPGWTNTWLFKEVYGLLNAVAVTFSKWGAVGRMVGLGQPAHQFQASQGFYGNNPRQASVRQFRTVISAPTPPTAPPAGGTTPPAGGATPPTTPPAGGSTPPAGSTTPPAGVASPDVANAAAKATSTDTGMANYQNYNEAVSLVVRVYALQAMQFFAQVDLFQREYANFTNFVAINEESLKGLGGITGASGATGGALELQGAPNIATITQHIEDLCKSGVQHGNDVLNALQRLASSPAASHDPNEVKLAQAELTKMRLYIQSEQMQMMRTRVTMIDTAIGQPIANQVAQLTPRFESQSRVLQAMLMSSDHSNAYPALKKYQWYGDKIASLYELASRQYAQKAQEAQTNDPRDMVQQPMQTRSNQHAGAANDVRTEMNLTIKSYLGGMFGKGFTNRGLNMMTASTKPSRFKRVAALPGTEESDHTMEKYYNDLYGNDPSYGEAFEPQNANTPTTELKPSEETQHTQLCELNNPMYTHSHFKQGKEKIDLNP